MSKVVKIKEAMITIGLVLIYAYVIRLITRVDTSNMMDYEYLSHRFYQEAYRTYFYASTGILILTSIYHFKLRKASFEVVYGKPVLRYMILVLFILGSQVIFLNDFMKGHYFNIAPTYMLMVVAVLNSHFWSAVYVSKDHFITGNKRFSFKEIQSAQYTDPVKIKLISKNKRYYIFCLMTKRYEFFRSLLQEKVV